MTGTGRLRRAPPPPQDNCSPQPRTSMDHFHYRDRVLHCEDVPLAELAEQYGTPLFVYSRATLLHHLRQLQQAFAAVEPLICYSVKTNGNLAICRLMSER